MFRGQSGSPIFERNAEGHPSIVGVNTGELVGSEFPFNFGIALNQEVKNFILGAVNRP